jgi:two-component system response regulator
MQYGLSAHMMPRGVLVVEDEPDYADLIRYALRKGGVSEDMVLVHSGLEALEFLFGFGTWAGRDPLLPLPDLVLLDLDLPKLSGFEVLERLRNNHLTEKIPVVILSSSARKEDITRSNQLGARFLAKPLKVEQLTHALQELIAPDSHGATDPLLEGRQAEK